MGTGDQRVEAFSYSKISLFEKCPKAYELKYVFNQDELFSTIEQLLGKSVHAAIEYAYAAAKGGSFPTLDSILSVYNQAWASPEAQSAKVVKSGISKSYYHAEGTEMLRSFVGRVLRHDDSETLFLEKEFEIGIDDWINYRGIIDRVSRSESGILRITDFKTGKRVPDPSTDDQIASYALWVFDEFNEKEIEVCYEDLREEQKKVARISIGRVPHITRRLTLNIRAVLEEKNFVASPSILCKWCGFNPVCDEGYLSVGSVRRSKSFQDDEDYDDPFTCPRCGDDLEERVGRYGTFIGCIDYPDCRYTRDEW